MLTVGDEKLARHWDVATGRPLGKPLAHAQRTFSVAYGPDHLVLTAGGSYEGPVGGEVRAWDLRTGKCLHTIRFPAPAFHVSFHPGNRALFLAATHEEAQLFSTRTFERVGKPSPCPRKGGVPTSWPRRSAPTAGRWRSPARSEPTSRRSRRRRPATSPRCSPGSRNGPAFATSIRAVPVQGPPWTTCGDRRNSPTQPWTSPAPPATTSTREKNGLTTIVPGGWSARK